MGIGEASATKDEVVEDAVEEAAQAEGIINTLSVPHMEVVSSWKLWQTLLDFFTNVNTIDMDDTV